MTNLNYTAICLLVDRSGSMISIKRSAEEGINEFLVSQSKAEGRRDVRIVQFDHDYEVVQELQVPPGDFTFTLVPRGSTALLDAMGRAISEFGGELAAMEEANRPGTVIFAVMTDGEENASHEYTIDAIKNLVERQENEYNWQVLYLGANQDAIKVAASMGIRQDRSMTYAASDIGTRSVIGTMDSYIAVASAGGAASFTDEDRERATRR